MVELLLLVTLSENESYTQRSLSWKSWTLGASLAYRPEARFRGAYDQHSLAPCTRSSHNAAGVYTTACGLPTDDGEVGWRLTFVHQSGQKSTPHIVVVNRQIA
jgi:hypothetical protein